MNTLIDKLERNRFLSKEEFALLIAKRTDELSEYLFEKARKIREIYYGKNVYLRGLIEFTNYCKNDCYYCGIRKSNLKVERYRLTKEQILACCETGYHLNYRTFVLQGGEDAYFTDAVMVDIIHSIKQKYPDCALTLSIGEKSYETYLAYYHAGVDRYLLRHETANDSHYKQLHPIKLSSEKRKQCLSDLKTIGFQVGTGFMVGSPYQTPEYLADDLLFIHELQPHMVGIGPFIPHHDTPFAEMESGTLELTLFLIGLLRLMLPASLLPSTTALGSIHSLGREKGLLAGANVIMPNLSPIDVRNKYLLYDNKICIGDEATHCRHCLERRVQNTGYKIVAVRGDCKIVKE
jgi:biotin synthase